MDFREKIVMDKTAILQEYQKIPRIPPDPLYKRKIPFRSPYLSSHTKPIQNRRGIPPSLIPSPLSLLPEEPEKLGWTTSCCLSRKYKKSSIEINEMKSLFTQDSEDTRKLHTSKNKI